jgi:FtsH-binding integral membrane protein
MVRRGVPVVGAALCSGCTLAYLWFDTRPFIPRAIHNATHFGLGRFGWAFVAFQMLVGVVFGAISIREAIRSPRLGLLCFQAGLFSSGASLQVVLWEFGEKGDAKVFAYWLITFGSLVLAALATHFLREAALKRRAVA